MEVRGKFPSLNKDLWSACFGWVLFSVVKIQQENIPSCYGDDLPVVGSVTVTTEVSRLCDLSSRLSAVEENIVKEDGTEQGYNFNSP